MDFNAPNDYYELECDTSKIPIPTKGSLNLPEGCDKFRILLTGRSGVGKSTLVSAVFGITPRAAGVSHVAVGTPIEKVWTGISLPGNDQLILHDSGGFEAGSLKAVDEVVHFVNWRRQQEKLTEQIHCIWYCISLADRRPIQEADKKFLKEVNVGQIPVVIVFTQFDVLVARHKSEIEQYGVTGDRLAQLARDAAVAEYTDEYRGPVEKEFPTSSRVSFAHVGVPGASNRKNFNVPLTIFPSYGINALIDSTTENLVNKSLRILWVSGQRHNADSKLLLSPAVGMSMFWRVQGTGAIPIIGFIGATGIYTAFTQVLLIISEFWRLDGTDGLIAQSEIRNWFLSAVFDINIAQRIGSSILLAFNPLGLLLSAVTASIFLKMVAGVTLIHEMLFWKQIDNQGKPITVEDIRSVTRDFQKNGNRKRMVNYIDGELGAFQGFNKQDCEDIMQAAIQEGRSTRYADFVRKQTIVTS